VRIFGKPELSLFLDKGGKREAAAQKQYGARMESEMPKPGKNPHVRKRAVYGSAVRERVHPGSGSYVGTKLRPSHSSLNTGGAGSVSMDGTTGSAGLSPQVGASAVAQAGSENGEGTAGQVRQSPQKATKGWSYVEYLERRIASGASDRDYERWVAVRGKENVVHDRERLANYQTMLRNNRD
jgi:hypothetical protein